MGNLPCDKTQQNKTKQNKAWIMYICYIYVLLKSDSTFYFEQLQQHMGIMMLYIACVITLLFFIMKLALHTTCTHTYLVTYLETT